MSINPVKKIKINTASGTRILSPIGAGTFTDNGGEIFNDYNNNIAGEYAHAEGEHTQATGYASHAEGAFKYIPFDGSGESGGNSYYTTASAKGAHAEGVGTIASGEGAHAEGGVITLISSHEGYAYGRPTRASGEGSHAEGIGTIAEGGGAHSEGIGTEALTEGSHASGISTTAGSYGYSVKAFDFNNNTIYLTKDENTVTVIADPETDYTETGINISPDMYMILDNVPFVIYAHNINHYVNCGNIIYESGNKIIYDGDFSIIEQEFNNPKMNQQGQYRFYIPSIATKTQGSFIIGHTAHTEGWETIASGSHSHAEGYYTKAAGFYSHAEGYNTIAAYASHAEGRGCEALGNFSHASGRESKALGGWSYAQGYHVTASGDNSHAEGCETRATANSCHAEGYLTEATAECAHAEGRRTLAYGKCQHVHGSSNVPDAKNQYLTIVGNGTKDNSANAHTLHWSGQAWFAGAVTSSGADYAEYFEWLDGNFMNEDRIGHIVALEGDKIRLAQAGDDYLGIVSGTATVIGDNAECEWHNKYLTDDYGRVIYEPVENTDGHEVYTTLARKLNPDYDASKEYISRSERPEWATVGVFGKLYVNDDGTCTVNSYATVGTNGIATHSSEKTNMRVMKRINDNIVLVLMK